MHPTFVFGRSVLAILVVLLPLPTMAQTSGSVNLNGGYLDRDAWRFGSVAGVNDQGFAPYLDFSWRTVTAPDNNAGMYWRAEGQRLGLETGRITLEAGTEAEQRFRVDYRRLSSYQFDDARTPVRGAGSTVLNLPAGWQAGGATTSGFGNLEESLDDINLWQRRHRLKLDYQRILHPAWTLQGEIRREQVDGTRLLGAVSGATGGNSRAALLPAPVNYDTVIGSFGLAYTGADLNWHLSYQASLFNNGAASLSWPTLYDRHPQWTAGSGFPSGRNQVALEPDNQAHQLKTGGSVILNASQRLHFDVTLGRQRQNAAFLPYTVNTTLLPVAELPRDTLQGRVDTSRLELRLHSRLSPRLNLVSRLSYRDRDNRTPVADFRRVRGDAVTQQPAAEARLNRPYGLSEAKASVDASYRVNTRLRLDAGLEQLMTERTFSETRELRETTAKVGLRSTLGSAVAWSGEYRHQRRRSDDYVGNRPYLATHVAGTLDANAFENHPLLRKYYLTGRERDQLRLQSNWQALTQLGFGATLAWSRDQYPDTLLGLIGTTLGSGTLDFSYTPTQELRISGFYNQDRYRNDQRGRSFRGNVPTDVWNADRNWQLTATDRFTSWGLGLGREQLRLRFGGRQLPGTIDMTLDYSHSRSSGDFDNRTGSALTGSPLPDLGTQLDSLEFSLLHAWTTRMAVRLSFIHERYQSRDFALENVGPATVANVLLPGVAAPQYHANWLTFGYRYEF